MLDGNGKSAFSAKNGRMLLLTASPVGSVKLPLLKAFVSLSAALICNSRSTHPACTIPPLCLPPFCLCCSFPPASLLLCAFPASTAPSLSSRSQRSPAPVSVPTATNGSRIKKGLSQRGPLSTSQRIKKPSVKNRMINRWL